MAILQLDPMVPVYSIEHNMEGYAFLVIDYSQEHDLLFTCAWIMERFGLYLIRNLSFAGIPVWIELKML